LTLAEKKEEELALLINKMIDEKSLGQWDLLDSLFSEVKEEFLKEKNT
jgi:hypothetical protein